MTKPKKHPLAVFREEQKVGPSVAAAMLAISRQSLFRIERGEQKPSVDLIRRIIDFTGGKVSANDLVDAA